MIFILQRKHPIIVWMSKDFSVDIERTKGRINVWRPADSNCRTPCVEVADDTNDDSEAYRWIHTEETEEELEEKQPAERKASGENMLPRDCLFL